MQNFALWQNAKFYHIELQASATRSEHLNIQTFEQKRVSAMSPCQSCEICLGQAYDFPNPNQG